MPEPTGCVRCCARSGTYCDRCDVLVGLPGLHVVAVAEAGEGLTVTVESSPGPVGCPVCGVVAASHGRRTVWLVDAPCFGRPGGWRGGSGAGCAVSQAARAGRSPSRTTESVVRGPC